MKYFIILKKLPISILLTLLYCLSISSYSIAADKEKRTETQSQTKMNNAYLDKLIRRIDENAKGKPGYWQFKVEKVIVTVITDEKADRMRILVPVSKLEDLDNGILKRLMQANFDSALDARYAIAQSILWSAYIHPLSPLNAKQFIEGIGQVVNLRNTFGGSYSSGALVFGGGDSKAIQRRKLIEKLLNKGLAI